MPTAESTEPAARALHLLDAVVDAHGGSARPGQQATCAAIADALSQRRHLVAEAPTGIGKTYALGAAAITWLADQHRRPRAAQTPEPNDEPDDEHRPRVVIATATLALQDQLIGDDLPELCAVAAEHDVAVTPALLKGRRNYLCLRRADDEAGSLFDEDRERAERLVRQAARARNGERSALGAVDDAAWRRLSSTSDDCPGARSCSRGDDCWAEAARRDAARADIVVVNLALYAAHLLAGEGVLPAHDAVIVDEAHALADTVVNAASVTVSPARLRSLERAARTWGTTSTATTLLDAAEGLADALSDHGEGIIDPTDGDLAVHLATARTAAGEVARGAGEIDDDDDAAQAASQATRLVEDLTVLASTDGRQRVAWRDRDGPLRCAPVEPAELLSETLWRDRTVVCVSATLRGADASGRPTFSTFLTSVGAPEVSLDTLAVPSPFDFRNQALLYVPKGRIPSPREPGWSEGVGDELWRLARAAGGRTLALFTSRAATERVAEQLRSRNDDEDAGLEILTQWDGPRNLLVGALRRRRKVVLCATRSFWTGVDIPGDACVVVAIDRLPFPRPDDPLVSARRSLADERGERSFEAVDLPLAAAQLAQGAGRLIRSTEDRGVVAVLDTRLATARWRPRILGALPPLRRTVDPDEVEAFLAEA